MRLRGWEIRRRRGPVVVEGDEDNGGNDGHLLLRLVATERRRPTERDAQEMASKGYGHWWHDTGRPKREGRELRLAES